MTSACLCSITLGVRDRARSQAFYRAVGFRPLAEDELGAILVRDGVHLVLRNWAALAQDTGVAPEASGFRGSHLTLYFSDKAAVDATYGTWIAAGAIGVRQPSTRSWGGYAGIAADPDGHLWGMCFAPRLQKPLAFPEEQHT